MTSFTGIKSQKNDSCGHHLATLSTLEPNVLHKIAHLTGDCSALLKTCRAIYSSLGPTFTKAISREHHQSYEKRFFKYPDPSTFSSLKTIEIDNIYGSPIFSYYRPISDLQKFCNLKEVIIDDICLNKKFPNDESVEKLSHCNHLVKVSISDCEFITDQGWLHFFERSQRLKDLTLNNANFTGLGELSSDSLKDLQSLTLSLHEKCSDQGINSVFKICSYVSNLIFRTNECIRGSCLASIPSTKLRSLYLGSNIISALRCFQDPSPEEKATQYCSRSIFSLLSRNKNLCKLELVALYLDEFQFHEDDNLLELLDLSNLETLTLEYIDMSGMVYWLNKASGLEQLELHECRNCRYLPNIFPIGLSELKSLYTYSLDDQSSSLSNIFINLNKLSKIKFHDFLPLIPWHQINLESLLDLDIITSYPDNFSKQHLGHIFRAAPLLERIRAELSCWSGDFGDLHGKLENVKFIDLKGLVRAENYQLFDFDIRRLTSGSKKLEEISLYHFAYIDELAILQIYLECPKLKLVNIDHCPLITKINLEKIMNYIKAAKSTYPKINLRDQ